MKSIYYLLYVTAIVTSGCSTFNIERYLVSNPIQDKLPPLELQLSYKGLESIGDEYFVRTPDGQLHKKIAFETSSIPPGVSLVTIPIPAIYTQRRSDAYTFIQDSFAPDLLETSSAKSTGKMKIDVLCHDTESAVGWLFTIPSFASLFTLPLLGFPYGCQTADVEVRASIMDKRDSVIALYDARRSGMAWGALYWGYTMKGCQSPNHQISSLSKDVESVPRAAHMNAVRNALEDIRDRIVKESKMLREKLVMAATEK